jgi:hypothetical protein
LVLLAQCSSRLTKIHGDGGLGDWMCGTGTTAHLAKRWELHGVLIPENRPAVMSSKLMIQHHGMITAQTQTVEKPDFMGLKRCFLRISVTPIMP